MIYFWAVVAVLVIWGIRGIVRWYNLPEVAKARAEKRIKIAEERTKRVIARRRRWYHKKNDEIYYQRQRGFNYLEAATSHMDDFKRIERGDYDNIPIPSERRWKWFRRRKTNENI